jgi:Protein of unknown function (DUF1631)
MQINKRVIQLAQERALFRFSAMAQLTVSDAIKTLQAASLAASGKQDGKVLADAKKFLHDDGIIYRERLDEMFRINFDRAMRTMYTDLRPTLGELSADTMSLIDDETINRQIEVDRVLLRLRDADAENLGRINIMIAQLHGSHEVRERENPFRPYIMARTLHDTLADTVGDKAVADVLYGHLSDALANHLPDYYGAIRDVFESKGVRARLMAQPSTTSVTQRRQAAATLPGAAVQTINVTGNPHGSSVANPAVNASPSHPSHSGLPPNFNEQLLPSLQRIVAALQRLPQQSVALTPAAQTYSAGEPSAALQDLIWKLFNQSRSLDLPVALELQHNDEDAIPFIPTLSSDLAQKDGNPTGNAGNAPASASLIGELNRYQQQAARGESLDEQISPDQNQLFSLREQIGNDHANDVERATIDVVAVLFEFILQDEHIPADVRVQIGRLQIPLLKASMLAPELLQHQGHPVRQLINRMGSATVDLDMTTAIGRSIADEITRITRRILEEFNDDISIFSDCLAELDQFLTTHLRNTDSGTALGADAIERAEDRGVRISQLTAFLDERLAQLEVDQRITDFITKTWVNVVDQETCDNMAADTGMVESFATPYRDTLAELVWSAQEKQTPDERGALIKLLPRLAKRLKAGLQLIQYSDDACQQAMDQLIAVHAQVLRQTSMGEPRNLPSLGDLRQHFAAIETAEQVVAVTHPEQLQAQASAIESTLAEQGVSASVDLVNTALPSLESDAEWMAQMQLGTSMEYWQEGVYIAARLIWISRNKSMYMFKLGQDSKLVVYSGATLIKALREGSIRPVEYAPVFDRAVESLLVGAGAGSI